MANSQDIEARLCAYIEGDLDPSQRQEIERHLDAHPQHRQMIQDLIRTRDLLIALPRADAPADLDEGLQGHLERAMLLGDDHDAHEPWRVQARRVPRLAVLSVVGILALALGMVILSLLRAASHPGHIAPVVALAPSHDDSPVAMLPTTNPSTRPSVAFAAIGPTTQPAALEAALTSPATQPATQPAAQLAAQPATPPTTQPATQPADVAQLANYSAGPTTEPAEAELDGQLISPPATQPSPTAAIPAATPTTAPVASGIDHE